MSFPTTECQTQLSISVLEIVTTLHLVISMKALEHPFTSICPCKKNFYFLQIAGLRTQSLRVFLVVVLVVAVCQSTKFFTLGSKSLHICIYTFCRHVRTVRATKIVSFETCFGNIFSGYCPWWQGQPSSSLCITEAKGRCDVWTAETSKKGPWKDIFCKKYLSYCTENWF